MLCLYPDSHYQDASARLGFVHIVPCRTDYLLDARGIFHIFHHSCIYGGVINLADRCLLRRYKQPNNRVCSGCDGSRCFVQKKTDQQVFTKNETEWNQQFTAVHSAAAAADRLSTRSFYWLFLSCLCFIEQHSRGLLYLQTESANPPDVRALRAAASGVTYKYNIRLKWHVVHQCPAWAAEQLQLLVRRGNLLNLMWRAWHKHLPLISNLFPVLFVSLSSYNRHHRTCRLTFVFTCGSIGWSVQHTFSTLWQAQLSPQETKIWHGGCLCLMCVFALMPIVSK